MTTTKTKKTRETLKQRLAIIRRDGLVCGLGGCPVGGWPETQQALARLRDDIPARDQRNYLLSELVDALYRVDSAGRYRWREGASR